MYRLKSFIAPVHFLRFKYLFNKNLEKSRRYFSMLLSLQSANPSPLKCASISESDIESVLQRLQRQRRTIELGKRIEQISSVE